MFYLIGLGGVCGMIGDVFGTSRAPSPTRLGLFSGCRGCCPLRCRVGGGMIEDVCGMSRASSPTREGWGILFRTVFLGV